MTQSQSDSNQNRLGKSFTPLGMWSFSIGTGIGWGSFIVTCNTYLQKSGVLGTVIGLLLGMGVILVVTWNLQHIIKSSPSAGGVYTFVKYNTSSDLGFISMWFIILTYSAVLWANVTSVPLFARFFLGDTFKFGFKYTIFGYEVWLGEALLSVCVISLIGVLCLAGSKISNRIMIVAALLFAVAFAVCAVIAIFRHDGVFSYSPAYIEGSSSFGQIVRIAVISPWAFIGYENISNFSEEYTFPVKKVKSILIWSVVITTLLYLFVSILSVSAYPPEYSSWLDYIGDIGNLEGIKAVPAFYAANYYLGQTGVVILMVALFCVILTSLIGNLLALSRLLYASGREGESLDSFTKLNKHKVPYRAILVIVAGSMVMPFLGRTAIGWIVDVTTLGATIIYALISYSVYKYAVKNHQSREKITGIIGIVLMGIFVMLLLIPGLLPFNAMETESYILFIVWAVLGLLYFRLLIMKKKKPEYEQRVVVWIILMMLVLFASMMWVSRETEKAADTAVQNIYEYHQIHPDHDVADKDKNDRADFLDSQAKNISSTNTMFTMVSLGLFILFAVIMMNNYQETKKLGKRLRSVEKEAENAKKLADSLAHGYEYMYYINIENGEYTEYNTDDKTGALYEVRKGHDFFEAYIKEAKRVVYHEDQAAVIKALAPKTLMETLDNNKTFYMTYRLVTDGEPVYVSMNVSRLEDNENHIVLCVTDIDEEMKHHKAVERLIVERIAYNRLNALTGDILVVYIVDPETDRFREYSASEGFDSLSLPKEGYDFFGSLIDRIADVIFEEDLDRFYSMFSKQEVMDDVNNNGFYSLTYRLMIGGKPRHVKLKAAMVEEEVGPRLIIGLNDIESQVRHEEEYERRLDQAQTKASIDTMTGIKNKHAYLDEEEHLDRMIADQMLPEFAIVILDVNNLKKINDTLGHKAGDQFICDASKIICDNFKKSPVYRTGGDEFTVVARGDDYENITQLMNKMHEHNKEALESDGIVIACGMSKYKDDDGCVADVFERADQLMYENKSELKNMG
ncbi:MAG: amino acid permease [Eubacterium sp.]|nr:amino acid permease [Eubacterium sp.]